MKMKRVDINKFIYFFLSLIVIFILFLPIYATILGSLTPSDKIGDTALFPKYFHYQNCIDIWHKISLSKNMINSIFYAACSSLIAVLFSVPAGYGVSRFQFKGKETYLFIILLTQMLSVIAFIVPLFFYVLRLGLFDTRFAIIVISAAIPIPMMVWLLKGYFDAIPVDIEEAAMVDGCTRIGAMIKVIIPVSLPGVATVLVLSFIIGYNQFFIPLVLLTSPEKLPVLVGVYTLANYIVPPWEFVMTATLIGLIPPLIAFFIGQKWLMSGLTGGSIK